MQSDSRYINIPEQYLHDACKLCKLRNRVTKTETDGENVIEKGSFPIRCYGIPKDPATFVKEVFNIKDEAQAKEMATLISPSLWANKYLKTPTGEAWTPRGASMENYEKFGLDIETLNYQWLLLNCTAKKSVFRAGRRLGKCLWEESLVLTKERGYIPIKDIKSGEHIKTYDFNTGSFKWTDRWNLGSNGKKEVWKLELLTGEVDYVTDNHPFLVWTGGELKWIEYQDLKIGDLIATIENHEGKLIDPRFPELYFSPVVKFDLLSEERETLDFTVPETHNFVANGTVTHNTEVLDVIALFNVMTNSNFRVLIVAPMEAQIKEHYKRICDFIESSPIKDELISRKQTPFHELVFKNGSIIRMFTASTKSGAGATSIRGQSADMVIADEADYMNNEDHNTIAAFMMDNKHVRIFQASTPSGRRARFYENCHNPTFREFHFPSMANPNWDEHMEADLRSALPTESAYEKEVLAVFGSDDEGVFQKSYIDRAKMDYKYEGIVYDPNCEYYMGVDWNPKKGTEIIVIEASKDQEGGLTSLSVVDSKTIQKLDYQEIKAVQLIVEMNRQWRPKAIYVDSGAGAMQYQILHKHGLESKYKLNSKGISAQELRLAKIDSKLHDIVKDIQFGSSVEVMDPFTHEKKKVPLKPLMVESAVRRFEQNLIRLSIYDKLLISQLEGYIIQSVNADTGRPVYGFPEAVGDHKLDAFVLALWAHKSETENYVPYVPGIAYSSVGLTEKPDHEEEKKKPEGDRGHGEYLSSEIRVNHFGYGQKLSPYGNKAMGFERSEPGQRRFFGAGRRKAISRSNI